MSAGFAVALLAAIESLLSAKVADGMADRPRHDPNRELFGQGLANLVSPLFGGMPATGAIARTAVNVRAGARTRLAAVVHAVVLLLIVLFLGGLVSQIPLAALAGVLMVTAVRMVEPHNVRAVLTSTRSDAVVLLLTAAATITFDLIVAVEVGVAVAAALALRNVARNSELQLEQLPPPAEVTDDDEAALLHDHIVVYRLDGALFFGAAQRFLTDLTAVTRRACRDPAARGGPGSRRDRRARARRDRQRTRGPTHHGAAHRRPGPPRPCPPRCRDARPARARTASVRPSRRRSRPRPPPRVSPSHPQGGRLPPCQPNPDRRFDRVILAPSCAARPVRGNGRVGPHSWKRGEPRRKVSLIRRDTSLVSAATFRARASPSAALAGVEDLDPSVERS